MRVEVTLLELIELMILKLSNGLMERNLDLALGWARLRYGLEFQKNLGNF